MKLTHHIELALLQYAGGQHYPIIIGDDFFTLKINSPAEPPSFKGSYENEFFYKSLSGGKPEGQHYTFALLMLQAKQLLDSSYAIRTMAELAIKEKEFHDFVRQHYQSLQHSDMVQQLIAQYFMMHEYVDYRVENAPATDIKIRYQQGIIHGVKNWLEFLKIHIRAHGIFNFCVSLYYNRGMVTLASLLIENFRDVAYCPGADNMTSSFPDDLLIVDANGNNEMRLNELKGNKIIAFVSDDCPVSIVETVSKARKLIEINKDVTMIVAPLQKLSEKHLALNKMVSGGNMFFVNDVRWQQGHIFRKVKLPLFQRRGASFN